MSATIHPPPVTGLRWRRAQIPIVSGQGQVDPTQFALALRAINAQTREADGDRHRTTRTTEGKTTSMEGAIALVRTNKKTWEIIEGV
ncbi:hypothetical protein ZHAS_00021049 [Anopheles sinensis]|uniref:Uncharacterized protein n=1 Tax=Anopheles sinensis TaxID=74873 RepID=A0A084WRD9_ANOSI|nr:hypothetical protein ZHAS_00021049 [Anopheles sinensis]